MGGRVFSNGIVASSFNIVMKSILYTLKPLNSLLIIEYDLRVVLNMMLIHIHIIVMLCDQSQRSNCTHIAGSE